MSLAPARAPSIPACPTPSARAPRPLPPRKARAVGRLQPDDDVVVCLPGLLVPGTGMRPLGARLAGRPGLHAVTLPLPLGPGIHTLALRLADLLTGLPRNVHLHLVGQGVGGIVGRYYAQHLRDGRLVQTVSLASPFGGLRNAGLLGLPIARDVDPMSPLLAQLRLAARRACGVPHLSVVSVRPGCAAAPSGWTLPGCDLALIRSEVDLDLLQQPAALRIVQRRVLEHAGSRRATTGVA